MALLFMGILVISFRPPLVVLKEAGDVDYLKGRYEAVEISEKTIEKLVRKFIHYRYEWRELNPERIARNFYPLTTKEAGKKIKAAITKLKEQNFKGKRVSQSVTNVKVQVTKKKVAASFDKILKLEGLPLPIPTHILLNIVKGESTVWNPEGLYIHGIIERQVN